MPAPGFFGTLRSEAVAEEFGQQRVVAVFELLEGLQVAVDAVGFGVVFDYRELSVLDRTAQHLQRRVHQGRVVGLHRLLQAAEFVVLRPDAGIGLQANLLRTELCGRVTGPGHAAFVAVGEDRERGADEESVAGLVEGRVAAVSDLERREPVLAVEPDLVMRLSS